MKLKAVLCAVLCYLIWGSQSLFWNLFHGLDSVFLLCSRVIFAFIMTVLFLLVTKRGGEIIGLVRDKSKMKFIAPASLLICADWGLFIWAVTNGHVIDSSIGYYLNPLVIFLLGVILFKEKASGWEITAVVVACLGVLVFTVMSGSFPLLSLAFAVIFPVYALLKKYADSDPIVSIAVETMILTPLAIAYILIFGRGSGGVSSITAADIPLLFCSGVVTALPMILYTAIVNELPMKAVGIMQYFGTTMGIACGALLLHEAMTPEKWIIFAFIWAGIIIFTAGEFRKSGKEKSTAEIT